MHQAFSHMYPDGAGIEHAFQDGPFLWHTLKEEANLKILARVPPQAAQAGPLQSLLS